MSGREELSPLRVGRGRHAKIAESTILTGSDKESHDRLFTVQSRKRADSHLDLWKSSLITADVTLATRVQRLDDSPLLRDIRAIGQQLRQHLQPGDDVGRHVRNVGDGLEYAVDPPVHVDSVPVRHQMDITCSRLLSGCEDQADQIGDVSILIPVQGGELLSKRL